MIDRRYFLMTAAASAVLTSLVGVRPAVASLLSGRPGFFTARDIAEAGFIYGLPIVMNYGVMYEFCVDKTSGQYKGPFNTISNEARVFTWEDTSVVTPNSDTPYSMLWLDLRAEPMVISVPAVDPKRYYSVQLIDGNTFNYGYIGSRATGTEPGDYLVVGPRWVGARPAGVKGVFRSTTDFSLVIFRTQLFDAKDIDAVKAVQAGYGAKPLSAFLGEPAPTPAALPDFPVFAKDLVEKNFFEYLDFALQFAPALPAEQHIRSELARIGVGPDKTFSFSDLSLEDKAEVLTGMKAGKEQLDAAVKAVGADINGWRVGSVFGDADFFHGDWSLRAAAAQMGIYGNNAEEAMYPATKTDGDGVPLDTSTSSYTLTFAAGELPPVNAFWSVTMYDGKTQLLIKNPIDRYLINSPMLPNLKTDADGGITIHISRDSPGADKESNWLPAPDGPAYLVMRLYWPKTTAPSILPPGTGTWKPPGLHKA
jgi:hypothetical protein